MKSTVIRKGATASIILGFGALLSACGGGGGGSSSAVNPSSTPSNNTITGYTVDGPFSANITVYGFEGTSSTSCGSGTSLSSNSGYFSISLNSSCSGPYLISATASSGTDAGEVYYYLAAQPVQNIYVTPASTAIVEANAKGNSTTAILPLLSSLSSNLSSLSSIEQQESQYSGSSISFVHVFFPYSYTVYYPEASNPNTPNVGADVTELIYPINYASNTIVPVLVKEFLNGNLPSGTFFPSLTFSGFFSTSDDILSITQYDNVDDNVSRESQTFIFSGSLNDPSSLSILAYSDSSYNSYTGSVEQCTPGNCSYTNGFYFTNYIENLYQNGTGQVILSYNGTLNNNELITTNIPIAKATSSCTVNYISCTASSTTNNVCGPLAGIFETYSVIECE